MPQTFTRADESVASMLAEAMRAWHPALTHCEVTIDVLLVDEIDEAGVSQPTLKHQGYGAAASVELTPLKRRALGQADALIVIDTYAWTSLRNEERLALLDHELQHVQVCAEKPHAFVQVRTDTGEVLGEPLLDDLKRPKLKLRQHDAQIGLFHAVVRRHGRQAVEMRAVLAVVDEFGQATWNFDGAVSGVGRSAAE